MRLQDFCRDVVAVKVFFIYRMVHNKEAHMKNRFKKVYGQGTLTCTEIWVDCSTGVNYLYHCAGYSGGLTVLLDEQGKPVITPKYELDNEWRN